MPAVISTNGAVVSTNTSTTGTSITGTNPVCKQYDCLLAYLMVKTTSASAPTFPAGWTQLMAFTATTHYSLAVFYKNASAADAAGGTVAISWTTAGSSYVAITAWTGTDPFNPICMAGSGGSPLNQTGLSINAAETASTVQAATTTPTCPAVPVYQQNSMLVSFWLSEGGTVTVDASETQLGGANLTAVPYSTIGYLNQSSLTAGSVKTGSTVSGVAIGVSIVLNPPVWTQNNTTPAGSSPLSIVGSYSKFQPSSTPLTTWTVTFGSYPSADDTWAISLQPGDVVLIAMDTINPGPLTLALGTFWTAFNPIQLLQAGSGYTKFWSFTVPPGVPLTGTSAYTALEFVFTSGGFSLMMVAIRGAAGIYGVQSSSVSYLGNQTAIPVAAMTVRDGNDMQLCFYITESTNTPTLPTCLTSILAGHATGYGGACGYMVPGNVGTTQSLPCSTPLSTCAAFGAIISASPCAQLINGFPFTFVQSGGMAFPEPALTPGSGVGAIVTGSTALQEPLLITGVWNAGSAGGFANGVGTISGNVEYLGVPYQNGTVMLYQRDGGIFVASTTTDANGNYSFPSLNPSALYPTDYFVVFLCPAPQYPVQNPPPSDAPYNSIILDQLTPG